MLEGYTKRQFSAALSDGHQVSHDVYSRGDGPATIIIIQELPGIGPETLSLADAFFTRGFRVVMPHLLGPLGKVSLVGNLIRVFCMRRQFKLFEKNQSSPIVDWLKALCRDEQGSNNTRRIGVVGMCLTGNFALSLIADDAVLAAVASQPSLPFNDQEALHMSTDEIAAARASIDQKGNVLALRFEGDPLCRAPKFEAIDHAFNDETRRVEMIELPGKGHSVLTLDLIKGGAPARAALDKVLNYFESRLQ
ncbi:MAG: dienelactone hydrolase family protein [Pseudomonadales bacterium]|mgnify:CR=1 FL=1